MKLKNNNDKSLDKIVTEDECLALIADYIFGRCRGYTPGKSWTEVIKLVEKCKSGLGIVDNDNNQTKTLKERNWKLIKQESEIEIWEKNGKHIIVIGNSGEGCEDFLSERNKIIAKDYNINKNQEVMYKINILKNILKSLNIM